MHQGLPFLREMSVDQIVRKRGLQLPHDQWLRSSSCFWGSGPNALLHARQHLWEGSRPGVSHTRYRYSGPKILFFFFLFSVSLSWPARMLQRQMIFEGCFFSMLFFPHARSPEDKQWIFLTPRSCSRRFADIRQRVMSFCIKYLCMD